MKKMTKNLLFLVLMATATHAVATNYNLNTFTGGTHIWTNDVWNPSAGITGPTNVDAIVINGNITNDTTISYAAGVAATRSVTSISAVSTTDNNKNLIFTRGVAGSYLQFHTTAPTVSSDSTFGGAEAVWVEYPLFQPNSTLTKGGAGNVAFRLYDATSVASFNNNVTNIVASGNGQLSFHNASAMVMLPNTRLHGTGYNAKLYVRGTTAWVDSKYVGTGTADLGIAGGGILVLSNNSTFVCGYLVMSSGNSAWNYANGNSTFIVDGATATLAGLNMGDQLNNNGTVTFNMRSGTTAVTGAGYLGYPNADGAYTQTLALNVSGGVLDFTTTANTDFHVGRNLRNNATPPANLTTVNGTVTVSGSGELDLSLNTRMVLAQRNASNVIGHNSGTLRLDGGVLKTGREIARGTIGTGSASATTSAKVYLNGGGLQTMANVPDLFTGFSNASDGVYISSGGARIHCNGFDVGIKGNLLNNGGGLTKLGAGTLTLSGTNTYAGTTTVEAGRLIVTTESTDAGGYAVSNNATLQVNTTAGETLNAASLSLAGSSTLELRNVSSTSVPVLTLSGALASEGTSTVQVLGTSFAVGDYPLVQYGSLAGSGTLAFAELPYGVTGTFQTNTVTKVIYLSVSAVVDPLTWKGLQSVIWDINSSTNWSNSLTTGVPYLEGDTVRFDDTATGATTVTLDTTVNPGGILFANTSKNYVITGIGGIAGSATMEKTGSGTVTLATANGYSGQTTIREGTLQIGNGGTVGSLGTGPVMNQGTLVYNRTDAQTWTQPISGSGSLTKQGNGVLTLAATNAYGTTTVTAGTLQIGNGGTSGTLGSGPVTVTGTLEYNRSDDQAWSQALTGAGKLIKNRSGTLTLSSVNNSYLGGTTINSGTIALGGQDRLPTLGVLTLGGNNSTLNMAGYQQTVANLLIASTAGASITGRVMGAGTLIVNGANSMTVLGDTTANSAAILDLSGLASFTLNKNADLVVQGNQYNGTNQKGHFILSSNANDVTVNLLQIGGVAGNAALPHQGILELGTSNTIKADTIRIANSARTKGYLQFQNGLTGTPSVILRGKAGGETRITKMEMGFQWGGTGSPDEAYIDFTRGYVDARFDTVEMGRISVNNARSLSLFAMGSGGGLIDILTLSVGYAFENAAGIAEAHFVQDGASSVVKIETMIMGNNAHTNNVVQLTASYNLTNGTLYAKTIRSGTGSGSFAATSTRNLNWVNGAIRNYDGATDLSISGTTNVGGVLNVNLQTTGLHAFHADGGRTITVDPLVLIAGAGAMTKDGAGTLVLNGANTYGGGTVVTNGTLMVNNTTGSATGTGAITLCDGATLSGVGSMSGALTVLQGGRLMPGTNALALNLSCGGLTLNPGAKWTINHTGVTNNSMTVNGSLHVQGANEVDLLFTGEVPPVYTTLAIFTGSFSGAENLGSWTVNGYNKNKYVSSVKVVGNTLMLVTTKPGTMIMFR